MRRATSPVRRATNHGTHLLHHYAGSLPLRSPCAVLIPSLIAAGLRHLTAEQSSVYDHFLHAVLGCSICIYSYRPAASLKFPPHRRRPDDDAEGQGVAKTRAVCDFVASSPSTLCPLLPRLPPTSPVQVSVRPAHWQAVVRWGSRLRARRRPSFALSRCPSRCSSRRHSECAEGCHGAVLSCTPRPPPPRALYPSALSATAVSCPR